MTKLAPMASDDETARQRPTYLERSADGAGGGRCSVLVFYHDVGERLSPSRADMNVWCVDLHSNALCDRCSRIARSAARSSATVRCGEVIIDSRRCIASQQRRPQHLSSACSVACWWCWWCYWCRRFELFAWGCVDVRDRQGLGIDARFTKRRRGDEGLIEPPRDGQAGRRCGASVRRHL